jgi:hypothetical protein
VVVKQMHELVQTRKRGLAGIHFVIVG